jgi:hypothetical protein
MCIHCEAERTIIIHQTTYGKGLNLFMSHSTFKLKGEVYMTTYQVALWDGWQVLFGETLVSRKFADERYQQLDQKIKTMKDQIRELFNKGNT